ncbi:MAG: response regulator [Candidatus Binatia bacterium]
MNVLLVEDDSMHAQLIQLRLARQPDVTVVPAPNIRRARELLGELRFQLVLLDFSLPDGDGLELFFEIRARFAGLPVVFLTAADSAEICARALKGGALDYLVKKRDYLEGLPRVIRKACRVREASDKAEAAAQVPNGSEAASNCGSPPAPRLGERARIKSALERNHWNRTRAARELGFSRVTLWRRMWKYGLGA